MEKKIGVPIGFSAIVGILLIFWACGYTPSSPGIERIGYYKSSGATTMRVISCAVESFLDTEETWEKIEAYAKRQMYTEGGSTIVFFFNGKEHTPDLTLVGLEFPDSYEQFCVAGYWKYSNGKQQFKRFPFK